MTAARLALAALVLGLVAWWYAPVRSVVPEPRSDYAAPNATGPILVTDPVSARSGDTQVVSSDHAELRDAHPARMASAAVDAASGSSTIAAPRPLDVIVNAPLQAVHGSEFEVSVGVGSVPGGAVGDGDGTTFQSATFHVAYDVDSLEVLGIVDAEGTALATVVRGDGSVELEFDRRLGATQWPAVRFLARADAPHISQLTVTADVTDHRGEALATAPSAPVPIMLLP